MGKSIASGRGGYRHEGLKKWENWALKGFEKINIIGFNSMHIKP